MKEMDKTKIIDKHSETLVLSERTLLAKIKHPFIVNMYYSFQDNYTLYLILDFMQGGDLRYHLCHHKCFTEPQTKFIIANVILSLEYIHYNRTIHRDIKPENLVMDERGYVKLTDFGVAKLLTPPLNSFSNDSSGTPGYMAPEALCGINQSYVADYFAVGVLCYELLTGLRPYMGKSRKEIKEKIMAYQAKFVDYNRSFSVEAVDFINKLIKRKPGQRLGINGDAEVKNHLWFKNFNWKELYLKRLTAEYVPVHTDNFDYKYCNENESVSYDTIHRYENIKANMTIYNNNIFINYHDYNPRKRDRSNVYKNKDVDDDNKIIFVNPHLVYEEYIDDKVIISDIITPTLVMSKDLDKKYFTFRKKSNELLMLDNAMSLFPHERRVNSYRSRINNNTNSDNGVNTYTHCNSNSNNNNKHKHQRNKNIVLRNTKSSCTSNGYNNNNYNGFMYSSSSHTFRK